MKLEPTTNIILDLFRIRDIAHIIHLQTTSYSEHKALDTFYTEWLELADDYIETYQGQYGREKMTYKGGISLNINNSEAMLTAALSTCNTLRAKHPDNTGLNNIVDELLNLIHHTKYLLTLK